MNQYPSRLSRNELYSYGFKEGQPWGEDRRTLESALRAMDQLEREIQQDYIYNRAAPSNPWSPYPLPSSAAPRPYIDTTPRAYYHAQAQAPTRPPPDICINRSNGSESSSDSEMAQWSGRQNEYAYPGYVSEQSGRPNRYYHPTAQSDPPAAFHRPSMARTYSQGRPGSQSNVYAPPLSASNSSYSRFRDVQGGFPEGPSFYHSSSPPASPHSPTNASQPFSSAGQMQVTRYDNGHGQHDEHPDANHYSGAPPSSAKSLSPGWSMAPTGGTGSENHSRGSSEGQGYPPEEYKASSGYVESYNPHSQGGYHSSSYLDYRDAEDPDHDYMSDGVASDEGVYYSSSEGPDEGEGDDVYSDGGYSSPADGYDDDSYGDSD